MKALSFHFHLQVPTLLRYDALPFVHVLAHTRGHSSIYKDINTLIHICDSVKHISDFQKLTCIAIWPKSCSC